jgi:pyruvate/2-oxoglutarate dehydrogenase complex dihydrolipoamide dehydrogenase (E3) component
VTRFDAIILGAGQAGPPLAGRLTKAGMKVALIERKLFGGTCVNTGCIPTKTLVASAYAAHLARRSADYGIVVPGAVRIDMPKVKARADAVSASSRTGVESWLQNMEGCTVLRGHARFEASDVIRVGQEQLTAPRIFINVGGRALVPEMPGIGDISVLTNTTILALDRVPRHLVVIGGSYVGLEFAQMYRRFGAEVTVVERAPRLVSREDEDVSAEIRRASRGTVTTSLYPSTAPTARPRPEAPMCSWPSGAFRTPTTSASTRLEWRQTLAATSSCTRT